jgi:hypothetical protein
MAHVTCYASQCCAIHVHGIAQGKHRPFQELYGYKDYIVFADVWSVEASWYCLVVGLRRQRRGRNEVKTNHRQCWLLYEFGTITANQHFSGFPTSAKDNPMGCSSLFIR